jgi:hypothetical protein
MKFTNTTRSNFLTLVARNGQILENLAILGIHRSSYYNRRTRYPAFDHAVEIAHAIYVLRKANDELADPIFLPAIDAAQSCLDVMVDKDGQN